MLSRELVCLHTRSSRSKLLRSGALLTELVELGSEACLCFAQLCESVERRLFGCRCVVPVG